MILVINAFISLHAHSHHLFSCSRPNETFYEYYKYFFYMNYNDYVALDTALNFCAYKLRTMDT
jgi:hypothetical protein